MNADIFYHQKTYGVDDFINRWKPYEKFKWMEKEWVLARKPLIYGLVETSIIKMGL